MSRINNLYIRIILGIFIALVAMKASGQSIAESKNVEVTFNKTSSVIFPASILTVDRGSKDVIVQKVKGVENVLQLKAARSRMTPTNLTVITTDGVLYHFYITYSVQPAVLTIQISNSGTPTDNAIIFKQSVTENDFKQYADTILSTDYAFNIKVRRSNKMQLFVKGIFVKNKLIFYHLRIKNKSGIDYDVDQLNFYIRDNRQVKRTASQEILLQPVYLTGNTREIMGYSEQDIVLALNKFTLPDAKHLVIELTEKNGGRNLSLVLANRNILQAWPLPDIN